MREYTHTVRLQTFITTSQMSCEKMLENTNKYLPEDIAVLDAKDASLRFHSRLNAASKHYRYRILNSSIRDVFNIKYQYMLEKEIDTDAMAEAAEYLIGEHDFKSFCGNKHMKKSTVRRIDKIEITQNDKEIILDYYGNGFLQYMVRLITGTLVEVGLHNMKPEQMKTILDAKSKDAAAGAAPAHGLALMQVFY